MIDDKLESLITFLKSTVESVFKYKRLNELHYRFLTESLSPFQNYEVEVVKLETFLWKDKYTLKDVPEDYYTHECESTFQATCQLRFTDTGTNATEEIKHTFDLTCNGWVSVTGGAINFNLLDEQSLLLKKYDQRIKLKIQENSINTLWEDKLKFNGKNGVTLFSEVINKQRTSTQVRLNAFESFDDIARCASDIRFIIGEILVYKPYLTNYLEDKMEWNGRTIFRHFPSFYDKQYWLKSGLLFQLLYNYWDKIGDVLAPFFAPNLPPKKVFFGAVIDNIPNQITDNKPAPNTIVYLNDIHNNPYYLWLKSFKDNEFTALNDRRIRIVHYTNLESEYFQKYTKHNTNETEMKNLQKEKDGLVDYFLLHYEKVITGFEQTLLLINELP